MAIALVQQKSKYDYGTVATGSLTFDSNVTAGNTILVSLSRNEYQDRIEDSQGNVYTLVNQGVTNGGTGFDSYQYIAVASSSGPLTVTFIGFGGAGNGFRIYEFSGVGSFVSATNNSENTTTPSVPAITPAVADSLYFASIEGLSGPFTPDAGWTSLEYVDTYAQDFYKIHSGTTPLGLSWTDGAGRDITLLSVFSPAGGGGGGGGAGGLLVGINRGVIR